MINPGCWGYFNLSSLILFNTWIDLGLPINYRVNHA